ncbi:hypothetical protein [Ideonella sp.]|uniref:hypothetical protein n=1 Tax=Ideonella sp. TaxID=1929293 RepID=UPI0035B47C5B
MARTYVYRPAAQNATDAHACPPSTPAGPRHRPVAVVCHPDATVVTKRIKPGRPGTKGALQQHGDALVCVRYRDDRERGHRYTTVELVIDQRPIRPQPLVRVHIAFDDAATRRAAQAMGAEWDPKDKTWRMPRAAAIQMGLLRNRRPPGRRA